MPTLNGTKSFYDYDMSSYVSQNLRTWLDYGLLEMGAYTAVKMHNPASGYTYLEGVYDPRYGDYFVYEGMGPSWVWESGVSIIPSGYDTIFQVSGVYVNSTFHASSVSSGAYTHKIDYANGRIIFDAALAADDVVQCEYVFKDIAVYMSDSPQWRTVVDSYAEAFGELSTLSPSGMAEYLKENRVWLPSVFVETNDVTSQALQLGGGRIANCEITYYVFSDNSFANKRLADVLVNQDDRVLKLYNVNSAPFPLKSDGTLASGALTYPTLSNRNGSYFWTDGYISNTRGGNRPNSGSVYRSEVRNLLSIDRYAVTY